MDPRFQTFILIKRIFESNIFRRVVCRVVLSPLLLQEVVALELPLGALLPFIIRNSQRLINCALKLVSRVDEVEGPIVGVLAQFRSPGGGCVMI